MKSNSVRLSAVVPADVAAALDRLWFTYRKRYPAATRAETLADLIRMADLGFVVGGVSKFEDPWGDAEGKPVADPWGDDDDE